MSVTRVQPVRPEASAVEDQHELIVHDRPTLAGMRHTNGLSSWWLLPIVDLVFSSLTLVLVFGIAGVSIYPALPIAPIVCVVAYGALGVYGRDTVLRGHRGEGTWPVARILVSILFAWVASLLAEVDPLDQIVLWATFTVLEFAARRTAIYFMRRLESPERWVLVGEDWVALRLREFAPLKPYAEVVCAVLPDEESSRAATREAALEIVDQHHADRVVITTKHADDEDLLELVRAFRSIGVPVSLMPPPLDLLEAPSVKTREFGGVPLIEIEALAAGRRYPYTGPDRRRQREVKVSVVVPAMNEEKNIGAVLAKLPAGLHEVILVDGNSKDATIAVAQAACPRIRVVHQRGRGKGDALRAGFATVTGNAVVMLDADGSADPAEIPRFVAVLEAGADFAKGSRYLPGGGSDDITILRTSGNKVLSAAANVLHGTRFTDLCYGYNAFWVRCLPFISLDTPGFEVETLINLRMASSGMQITEVPSYELQRVHGTSNLNTFRDGYRVLWTIFVESRWRLSRQRRLHRGWRKEERQRAEIANS
ncbi:MAG TPA: glycosyltransferase family 2 protein [Solirubrobacterales bacterium]|nr:glycosyltransferase family 2 protein [Solirubrobacterales bacterium]